MTNDYDLSALSDAELVGSLDALVGHDRQTTARLLAHLAEVDERRLYSRDAFSSLFDYAAQRARALFATVPRDSSAQQPDSAERPEA